MFKSTDSSERNRPNTSGTKSGLLRLRSDQRMLHRIVTMASGGGMDVAAELPAALQSEIAGMNRSQLLGLIEYSAALMVVAE